MAIENFFDESSEQSQVKTAIVSKYFMAWASVIIPSAKRHSEKLAYIDLFAGPGRYKDGTNSTPLLILEKAIAEADLRKMLVTMFNDKDEESSGSLQRAIDALPGVTRLKHKPKVYHEDVGEEIVKLFEEMNLVPTLFFVDPWGYKGLSLRLIDSVLKDWGCDCIAFFNYNRINMGLENAAVREHMDALFGTERAKNLRRKLEDLNARERELAIVEEICQALKELGGRFVLPFCFKNQDGSRTSHHLIFVSKHFRGYEIMKDIMARESSSDSQGVPSFVFNPADQRYPLLFELTRPLDDLEDMLLDEFRGQTLTMRGIYERHSIDKPYVKRNYKSVLVKLEAEGKIRAVPPAAQRPRRKGNVTFADDVLVKLPRGR
jgi:three-Cys-motif partner protein